MKKIYINIISASRILFGLLFLYFTIFDFNTLNLIIIFIATAISDISDGNIARKYGLSSNEGARFDVMCDFIFILFSTWGLVFIGLIPWWVLIVIILKLAEFFKTSGSSSLSYDKFGHFVALMFYAFPIGAILINNKNVILIIALIITVCAMVSSISRIRGKKIDFT